MRDLLTLPKANLHVHLEDAIRPQTVAEIAASHGVRLPPGTPITDSTSFFAAHDVVRTFGYSDAVIAGIARAGVRASFAPADVKAQLRSQIGTWLAAMPGRS
jgi:adenosine deaminase